jgi:uncharacterized membrane protein
MNELAAKDYAVFALIVAALFVFLLVVGNFGNLLQPFSIEAIKINALYQFIYISGSAVGALFGGALIFIVYRFREKGGK